MPSKKNQPKCMDMKNYVNVKKITKNLFNTKSCCQYRIYINGGDEADYFNSLNAVNDYINELKKKDPLVVNGIDVEEFRYLSSYQITGTTYNNYYKEYVNDIIHYIKLFLFRKIKVMSIVNLILEGGYFEYQRYDDIMSLKALLEYWYNSDADLEDYYKNFDNYKPIKKTFCCNFKKLQYLE